MSNYGEQICRSMEIIVAKRLEGLHYDRTIVCTITDDTLSKEGKYTVCYADTNNFTAYSHLTNLREGDTVYVSIPEGDWNEQKTIVSKKSRDNNEAFVYLRPFSRLVDITNNINENSEQVGLIANEAQIVEQDGKDLTDANGDYVCESKGETYQTIYSWKYDSSKDTPPLVGYTRLGIRGEFQSWLKEEGLVTGEYGLRLIIYAENKNTIEKDAETGETIMDNATLHQYVIYLNQDDMNGDPYNFQLFYAQEKIVDISAIERINQIDIDFYQKGNFANDQGEINLALEDWDKRPKVMPNLFVRDVYVSLGYGVEEFDEEKVLIYTLNKDTYGAEWVNGIENHKKIFLRWIHKDENGNFSVITEDSDLKYEIRWYKYELGHASADEYSGVYWKQLSRQYWDYKSNSWTYPIQDPKWKDYNTTKDPDWQDKDPTELDDNVHLPDFQSTWCIPEITLQDEAVKAIIVYDTKIIRSNILEFKNQRGVASQPTIEAISALSIYCCDNAAEELVNHNNCNDLNGNYLIYDLGGKLVNQADRDKIRQFIPYFNNTELTEAEWVEWIIPAETNSMIRLVNPPTELSEDGRYHIKFKGDITEALSEKNLIYMIQDYYSQWRNDNTIQCRIRKKGLEYSTTKELTFGHAGNNGTDWTVVLDFKTNVNAVTVDDTLNGAVIVEAHIYDYENKDRSDEITSITWGWKEGNYGLSLNPLGGREVEIVNNGLTSVPTNNYNILQAEIDYNDSSFKLVAYLPIPIRYSYSAAYMTGPVQITYDTAGHISHYRKLPYVLYDKTGSKYSATWRLSNGEGASDFAPGLEETKDGTYLKPLSVYVDDTNKQLCIYALSPSGLVLWSQPLLILQNRYPTAMINEWDGSLKVDEANNAIFAAQVVAGKKETVKDNNGSYVNTFSGVILGNVGVGSVENQFSGTTGLYGYSKGVQTYAFKEDGTAFIGPSGKGRIYFNGAEGAIYSAKWDTVNPKKALGMFIDLDDGVIKMNGSLETASTSYRQIGLTYNNYEPGKYYYWQRYKLATGNFNASTTYYRASSFKTIDLNGGAYYIQNTFYTQEPVSEENTTLTYKLSTGSYNSNKIYYCPTSYAYISLTEKTYASNTYYTQVSSQTFTKADSSIYNPTYTYYESTTTAARYIQLDATEPAGTGYPLSIGDAEYAAGRKFRVKWDGTVYIENGEFAGAINATSGTLGNLTVNGTLSGGNIIGAYINGADIYGGWIRGSYIEANELYAYNGIIGGWMISQHGLTSLTGGTVMSSDGTIEAYKIITKLGEIGGWYISATGLTNQVPSGITGTTPTNIVSLESNTGKIKGAIIETGTLQGFNASSTDNGIDVLGFLRIYQDSNALAAGAPYGYFGAMYSNYPGLQNDTAGLGMGYYTAQGTCVSQFKTTGNNVGFKFLPDGSKETGFMSIDADGVNITASSDKNFVIVRQSGYGSTANPQQGIYMNTTDGLYLKSNSQNSIQLHPSINKITLTANEIDFSGSTQVKIAMPTQIGTSTEPKQFDAYGASNFYNTVTLQNQTGLSVGGTTTLTGLLTANGGATIGGTTTITNLEVSGTTKGVYARLK